MTLSMSDAVRMMLYDMNHHCQVMVIIAVSDDGGAEGDDGGAVSDDAGAVSDGGAVTCIKVMMAAAAVSGDGVAVT